METPKTIVNSYIINPYTQRPFARIIKEIQIGDVVSVNDFFFMNFGDIEYVEKYRPSWFYDDVLWKIWERDKK